MTVPFAVGDPRPAWMLPYSAPRADVREARDFGAPRRGGKRIHVGIDLGSTIGEPVVSPEAGEVVAIQGPTWAGDTPSSAVLIATDSTGIVLNLGEVDPAYLRVAKGDRVAKGQQIGQVGPTGMLHFETYAQGTRSTKQWLAGDPPPPALLDPTAYVQAAAAAGAGTQVEGLPSWSSIVDAVRGKAASWWPSPPAAAPENRTPSSSTPSSAEGGGLVFAAVAVALVWGGLK